MFKLLEEQMMKEPQSVALGIQTISASRHLERIADLATNIAEDVVFMVDGEVIRHHLGPYGRKLPPVKR
jgi:phosphate transport system protein